MQLFNFHLSQALNLDRCDKKLIDICKVEQSSEETQSTSPACESGLPFGFWASGSQMCLCCIKSCSLLQRGLKSITLGAEYTLVASLLAFQQHIGNTKVQIFLCLSFPNILIYRTPHLSLGFVSFPALSSPMKLLCLSSESCKSTGSVCRDFPILGCILLDPPGPSPIPMQTSPEYLN